MNPIDPVNYLSCTILGLKTALFEAEKENRSLQKLLLSFYVKDAAKETDLYKMNRTGVKMNVLFQKEKQDLNLKIQELEARLTDAESENLNLNFKVKELKAFLEEKTNLLELYNTKDAKSQKLLLNNLKEKDLIQIIRNVLVCMKKSRVSRALQKSLRILEQRKNKNLKKIKTEDTDVEMSDGEIDLMSPMVENRLKEDYFPFKGGKNESFALPSIHESSEMPIFDLNESDVIGAETNSSPSNAINCISIDQPICSPLSIADSDYSSNGIKSVESLNSEKIQFAESSCGNNISLLETDMKPNCESSVVLAEAAAKSSAEIAILKPELNSDLKSETVLPVVSDLDPSYKIDILPAEEEVPKPICETDVILAEEDPNPGCKIDILPTKFNAEIRCKINAMLAESIAKPSYKIVFPEEDAKPSCETNITPPDLDAKPSRDSNIPLAKSHEEPNCKTNQLPLALDAKPSRDGDISRAVHDTSVSAKETVANSTEASVDIQSVDSVADTEQILECDQFIDPKIVNSAAELILSEMSSICYSKAIVESFIEFCEIDIRLDSDQNTSVRIQNTDKSPTSGSTSTNPAVLLVSQDVSHESIPVKNKTDSSQNNNLKKIRSNENVTNLSAESTTLATVQEENTKIDGIHLPKDETNLNSLKAQNDNSKIDSRLEHQQHSIPNNAIIQDAYESPDDLLPHPNVHEIGTLESRLDKPILLSDIRISERPQTEFIFDVETNSTYCGSTSVLNVEISASYDQDSFSISLEKKSDSNAEEMEVTENENQVKDTEFTNEEMPAVNNIPSIREAGKDLFCILNEFASLEKEMHRRITAFKEFLQQDDRDATEMLDKMEYIVVAEILENSDLELSEAVIDGSCLTDDILNSLHKTRLKTVEFQTSKENLNIYCENRSAEEESFALASESVTEVNDTSDDEKDELIIAEDDHIGDNSVADTAFNKDGVFRDEKNNRGLISAKAVEKQVSNSSGVHSVLKREPPIKEITNIPRYNFRKPTALTESTSETSRSLHLLPVENPTHLSECNRVSTICTAEEALKTVQMQFYVENQTSTSSPSLYVSAFDEVWSQIKSDWYKNFGHVTSDTTDLIPCESSIMKFVFMHRGPQLDLKIRKEKVLDLTLAKKSLEVFLKEKIRSFSLAFDTFAVTVFRSNKTTLCCAMIEVILDSITSHNARRNEIIFRDFINLSDKLDSTMLPGFVDALKNELKTRMWVKNWRVKKNGSLVNDLRVLSKFFTKLCKLNDDSLSVISLLREILISFKFRGHPIAFSVLNEWPNVFPRDAQERNLVVHIILFTLINHRMSYNVDLYNIVEVQHLIKDLFNVKLGLKTAEEYAKELMLQFYDTTWEDAITLLCKRQMFPWTYSNVIMKYFLPILKKWKTEFCPEDIMNKVLRTLKTLLGACPYKDEENEMFNLDLIVNALKEILSSHKGTRELKETVILVLCDLSVFRFSLCVEVLENWKPADGVIRQSTFQLLRDQLLRYRPTWQDFLFPRKKSSRACENKRKTTDGFNGFHEEDSLRPQNTNAVIAVGVSRKMNKNRPLANRLLKDNPIPSYGKKKKKSKKKCKTKEK